MTRTETVARIERERVVAVLRLADPDKLRAVIDVTVGALFAERTVAFGNARTTVFPSSVRRP